jgi:hypothetical protein
MAIILVPAECGTEEAPCESHTDHCQNCGEFKPAEGMDYCARCCEHEFDPADPSVGIFHAACQHCGETLEDLYKDIEMRLDDLERSTEGTYGEERIGYDVPDWWINEYNWRAHMAEIQDAT